MTAPATSRPAPKQVHSWAARFGASAGFLLTCYGTGILVAFIGYRIVLGAVTGQEAVYAQRRFLATTGDLLLLSGAMWICYGVTVALSRKASRLTLRERLVSSSAAGVIAVALTIACQQFLDHAYAKTYVPTLPIVGTIILPTVAATLFTLKVIDIRQRQ